MPGLPGKKEEVVLVKLFWVQIDSEEWGCWVAERTRGKAKSLFYQYWKYEMHFDFTDLRTREEKVDTSSLSPQIFDDDCEQLEKLGLKFKEIR